MALPINKAPTFETTLPVTGQKVKFRPFLVKEEKALLLAGEDEDAKLITLIEVLEACTFNKLDVKNLALFQIEFLFAQIRGKSVGELVQVYFHCTEDSCIENDDAKVLVTIDITKVPVIVPEGHNSKIALFDDVGVVMKYPSIESSKAHEESQLDEVQKMFEMILNSVDYIYNSEEVWQGKDQTRQELEEFIMSLTQDQFLKVRNFFDDMPKFKYELDFNCPICKTKHHRVLEGMESFF